MYSSAEQRFAAIERSSRGFNGNTPSEQPAKNVGAIHGDAGKRVLIRSRGKREPLMQAEISLRVLRRIWHQHQVRILTRGDPQGFERKVRVDIAVDHGKGTGCEQRQGAKDAAGGFERMRPLFAVDDRHAIA